MKKQFRYIVSLSIITVLTFNIVFTGYAAEEAVLQISLDETIKRALDTSEELKIKEQKELQQLLIVNREKLRDLRFKDSNKQLKNIREIRVVRNLIARVLTLLNKQK